MSAKDDASNPAHARRHRILTVALAIVAGASVGAALALVAAPSGVALFESRVAWVGSAPRPGEWPGAPRAGESAVTEPAAAGGVLVVRAPRAERARELAAALMARRAVALRAILAAGDSLAERWGASQPPSPREAHLVAWRGAGDAGAGRDSAASPAAGAVARVVLRREPPGPEPTDGARCASLLLARARYRRDLADAAPAPWNTSRRVAAPAPGEPVRAAARRVADAAAAHDASALAAALVVCARAEDEAFVAGVPSPGSPVGLRAAAWRAWQRAQADSEDAAAARLLAGEPVAQRAVAARERDRALVALALRLPRPYDALLRERMPVWAPAAAPIAAAWTRLLATGAAFGAFAALCVSAFVLALGRARRPRRGMFVPERDPGAAAAWLHLVTGPSATAVARAVAEVAAHGLARGERVLVVDGGARLRLHDRFGRESRWGLMECLASDMPLVGLVQYGGRPGLYMLSHGHSPRSGNWSALGARLDDAHQHFGRVILALDSSAPREIGDVLAGRVMEGWWAEAVRRLPRAAVEFGERVGIALSGMDLSVVPHATLEVIAGRARAIAPFHGADGPEAGSELAAASPAVSGVPAAAGGERSSAGTAAAGAALAREAADVNAPAPAPIPFDGNGARHAASPAPAEPAPAVPVLAVPAPTGAPASPARPRAEAARGHASVRDLSGCAPEVAPAEPLVLDGDAQMRERLRFLAWTRRMQAENRRETAGVR